MNEKDVEVTVFEDTNLVAFLMLQGHKVESFKKPDKAGRVAFEVSGDVKKSLDEYNHSNTMVSIQEYIKCLRMVRNQMFNLKQTHGS